MATYKEIQRDIKQHGGPSVKTCWIAHVKELNGLFVRKTPNRHGVGRKHPCPINIRPIIEASMIRLGML